MTASRSGTERRSREAPRVPEGTRSRPPIATTGTVTRPAVGVLEARAPGMADSDAALEAGRPGDPTFGSASSDTTRRSPDLTRAASWCPAAHRTGAGRGSRGSGTRRGPRAAQQLPKGPSLPPQQEAPWRPVPARRGGCFRPCPMPWQRGWPWAGRCRSGRSPQPPYQGAEMSLRSKATHRAQPTIPRRGGWPCLAAG